MVIQIAELIEIIASRASLAHSATEVNLVSTISFLDPKDLAELDLTDRIASLVFSDWVPAVNIESSVASLEASVELIIKESSHDSGLPLGLLELSLESGIAEQFFHSWSNSSVLIVGIHLGKSGYIVLVIINDNLFN